MARRKSRKQLFRRDLNIIGPEERSISSGTGNSDVHSIFSLRRWWGCNHGVMQLERASDSQQRFLFLHITDDNGFASLSSPIGTGLSETTIVTGGSLGAWGAGTDVHVRRWYRQGETNSEPPNNHVYANAIIATADLPKLMDNGALILCDSGNPTVDFTGATAFDRYIDNVASAPHGARATLNGIIWTVSQCTFDKNTQGGSFGGIFATTRTNSDNFRVAHNRGFGRAVVVGRDNTPSNQLVLRTLKGESDEYQKIHVIAKGAHASSSTTSSLWSGGVLQDTSAALNFNFDSSRYTIGDWITSHKFTGKLSEIGIMQMDNLPTVAQIDKVNGQLASVWNHVETTDPTMASLNLDFFMEGYNTVADKTTNHTPVVTSGVVTYGNNIYNLTATPNESIILDGTDIIEVPDHSDFDFGDGTTDSAFSVFTTFELPTMVTGQNYCFLSKGDAIAWATDAQYVMRFVATSASNAYVDIVLLDRANASYIRGRTISSSALITGVRESVCVTYDGSGTTAGMTIRVGATDYPVEDASIGTYVSMQANTGPVEIGHQHNQATNSYFRGGELSHLGVMNRVMTQDEWWSYLNAIYAGGTII